MIFLASYHDHHTKLTMASSFRRRRPEESDQPTEAGGSKLRLAGLKGTKPWTGGITLTSSGLRDLDAILGGGIPLGTCILLQEDHWTDSLGRALVKYWCSEVSKSKCQLEAEVLLLHTGSDSLISSSLFRGRLSPRIKRYSFHWPMRMRILSFVHLR